MGGRPGASARSRSKAGAWIEQRPGFPNSAEQNTPRAVKRSRYLWQSHPLPRAAARAGQRAGRRTSLWDARQRTRLLGRDGPNGISRLRSHATIGRLSNSDSGINNIAPAELHHKMADTVSL